MVAVRVGWVVAVCVGRAVVDGVLLAVTVAVGVGLAGSVAEVVGVCVGGLGVAVAVAVAVIVAPALIWGVADAAGSSSRAAWPVGVGVIVLGTIWIVAWQPESTISVRRARMMRMLRIGVA